MTERQTHTATTTVEIDGQPVAVEVTVRERSFPWESKYGTDREYRAATRVYVGETESLAQNLMNRHSRPVKAYRAAAMAALNEIGLDQAKLAWSQKAGCSCGCSPGFVLKNQDNRGVAWSPGGRNTDIWVKMDAVVTESDPAAVERAEQFLAGGAMGVLVREA